GLLRDSDARRIECQGKTRTEFSAATVGVDPGMTDRGYLLRARLNVILGSEREIARAPRRCRANLPVFQGDSQQHQCRRFSTARKFTCFWLGCTSNVAAIGTRPRR